MDTLLLTNILLIIIIIFLFAIYKDLNIYLSLMVKQYNLGNFFSSERASDEELLTI